MGKTQQNIVILTGAGISQESGLDTFRDSGGIWSKVRVEDVATLAAFEKNPQRVHDFYNARREPFLNGNIKPNAAHYALARLEEYWRVGGLGAVTIITQNIDNLHELAGSQNIIHMHGEILKARCTGCNAVLGWLDALGGDEACPQCKKTKSLRPHVVWFGEVPLAMEQTYQLLEKCHLFVSIGTSGNVHPAAGFVNFINEQTKGLTVELNLEPSAGSTEFDQTRYGKATEIVPSFVDQIIEKHFVFGSSD